MFLLHVSTSTRSSSRKHMQRHTSTKLCLCTVAIQYRCLKLLRMFKIEISSQVCFAAANDILPSIADKHHVEVFQLKNWKTFSFMHTVVELWWADCVEWKCAYRVLPGWCLWRGGSVSVVFVFVLVLVGGAVRFVYTRACCGGIHNGTSRYMTFHRSTHECKQTWQHRQLAQTQTQTQHSLFQHRSDNTR